MKPSRLACLLLLLLPVPARADDTEEFLRPENWDGLKEYWTLDPKTRTVVGHAEKDPGFNTFFCSKTKYGDFEMTFQVQLKDGKGNSGLQVRSEVFDPARFRVRGPQVDVGVGYFGALYGEGVGGYLIKARKDVARPKEFNDYRVVVRGNHVTITVNGEVTVDTDFPDNQGKNPVPAEGIIAFQLHAGGPMTVTFRNITFTHLSRKK